MKQIGTMAFVLAASFLSVMIWGGFDGCFAAETPKKRVLIAYFSHSGNTREIAEQIREKTGGDLFEITVAAPYPSDYRECTERAKKEQQENARPALTSKIENLDSYDTVFIGYPNWWGTLPMPLFTFLEQYDFSGKTVIPFCTHEGSGLGRSAGDITGLCPKSTIRDGLAVRGANVVNARNDVAAWLKSLGTAD